MPKKKKITKGQSDAKDANNANTIKNAKVTSETSHDAAFWNL